MTDQTQPIRPAPPEVVNLVNRFTEQRAVYRSGKYNETQLRRDFLDPLCEALGWDVSNRKNLSETNRDVINEMSVEMEGHAKAADYAFKTNNKIFFFLEAKKPSVNIETNPAPAFQLRSYGWTAKLPFSVLSDFEQLAIYDCRVKPVFGDTPLIGRHRLYSYTDYVDKWDELYNLLSYDAVHAGSLDKLVETVKGKRGTADVDDDFLATMEHWREELARIISLRNLSLSQREINTAVQLIIDRIIFLRICEDRGIEPENGLREATDGVDVYGDLMELFKKADKKYNSGLFHFEAEKGQSSYPDTLTPTLKIDDKVLKDILANLYLPKSPYAFKYFSADILGQVYERFLGKVITLSDGHRSKVIEKAEVRKAGGVYYTPTYIVEYIVKNTVGELLKEKTPADMLVEPIRVLDPACGSGSFLLGAYQYLLDWYLNWYSSNDPVKWSKGKNPPIFDSDGWQLTMEKKKEILTCHIFGVDIDAQAVEVTKLSLLLKVVENPGQLSMLEERILPDLGENIKCGNSLIGPDYYENQQLTMFDSEEQYRVNAFDWHTSFPKAFNLGGFDAVIGNPPYDVMEKDRGESSWPHQVLIDYVHNNSEYEFGLGGKLNLYRFFIIRSFSLLKKSGRYGMIIPLSILADISCSKTRFFLFAHSKSLEVDCFPQKDTASRRVFLDAKLSTCIITCKNEFPTIDEAEIDVRVYPWNKFEDENRSSKIKLAEIKLVDSENLPVPLVSQNQWDICKHIYSNKHVSRLGDLKDFRVTRGEINQTVYRKFISDDSQFVRMLKGVEIGRFLIHSKLSQGHREWFNEKAFLKTNNPKEIITKKRLATQRITGVDEKLRIVATIIDPPCYFADSTNSIIHESSSSYSILYLLGQLNSRLFQWRFKLTSTNNNVGTNELDSMPFRIINFSDPAEVKQHDRMVALVETMLALHKASAAARLPDEKERLTRQIQTTDRQIDQLVYQLYGLSDDEIKIVEGNA